MKIAQMVKCSVKEQFSTISFIAVPLLAIIGYLVVDKYDDLKVTTKSNTTVFTREIGQLREAIVELKTTIRKEM